MKMKKKETPRDPNNPFAMTNTMNITKIPNISFTKNPWKYIVTHIDRVVQNLNTSKIFAGIMIIVLNIGSKFVNIKLSKSMEGYLKYTFSKQILVFAITWMGTRDIYIAFVITILFTILNEYLFNENSKLCCLSESFTNYHVEMLNNEGMENKTVSDEDIQKAQAILEKAKSQQTRIANSSASKLAPELGDFSPLSLRKNAPNSTTINLVPELGETHSVDSPHELFDTGIEANHSVHEPPMEYINMAPMTSESSMAYASA